MIGPHDMIRNKFLPVWQELEKGEHPIRARDIRHMDWADFRHHVAQQNDKFIETLLPNLYAGDIYILHQAFDPAFMVRIREEAFAYGQSRPSEFHKMLEGSPDFHRIIDLETGKKYSFQVCKHSYFFYPWNDDPLELFFTVNKRWRVIKHFIGLHHAAYETNTPKDGVVDRIQIAQYPSRYGFLEPHSDPYMHQRLFFSGYMSKRGVDYDGGGFYLVGENDKVVEIEDEIDVGDVGIGYATVYHGVAPCNRHLEPDWNSQAGRWFLSMYSNASDEVKDRHTGYPVKLDLPGVLP